MSELQPTPYPKLLEQISSLLQQARQQAVQVVNSLMVNTYWEIGQRIVEVEQGGQIRAGYGDQLIAQLSKDLTRQFGRGFSQRNLETMRQFYLAFKNPQTASAQFGRPEFPLSWSHYVLLIQRTKSSEALDFYHSEALRGGWSVRQLQRQIHSQFFERAALSKDKSVLLSKAPQGETLQPEEAIKDPFVLEFLNLKDEYSESDLEDALIQQLEHFLLELGSDFAFVGRQKRLRIGEQWFRVDLVFFHRRLRCLVIIDLKLGAFSHADAGQMHTYLNYAKKHWTYPQENPPVGLILCSSKDTALAQYALEGLPNPVLAAEYQMQLPQEALLMEELRRTRETLEERRLLSPASTEEPPEGES